jgi:hypothetical protein
MPNAVFVRHLVSFLLLPHCRPLPALVCRRCSTPLSSVAITIRGSRRELSQSSLPNRCLRRLSPLSLVAVSSPWRPPSFQFILLHCRRRHCRRRHRFLSVLVIIAIIYCPPLPRLLSLAPSLVSCRALSLPPLPASTLTSGEIGQQRMGGGVR